MPKVRSALAAVKNGVFKVRIGNLFSLQKGKMYVFYPIIEVFVEEADIK